MFQTKRPALPVVGLITSLLVLLTAQTAFAQDDAKTLLSYSPDDVGAVFGMNLGEAKSSTFYKEGLKLLKTAPEYQDALGKLQKSTDINLEKDIHAVVAFTPKPTSSGDDTAVVILSGKFNKEKIVANAKKEGSTTRQLDKLTIYSAGDTGEFTLLSDKLLVIVTGKETFRNTALNSFKKKSKSQPKALKSLVKHVDTSKHLWFSVNTSNVSKTDDQPTHVAMTLDFSKGLTLNGWARMKSEEGAKKALEEYAKNKEQLEGGAAMIGAPSFAKNLKITNTKNAIKVSSSMPDKEVKAVLNWAQAMIESQNRK